MNYYQFDHDYNDRSFHQVIVEQPLRKTELNNNQP